MLFSTKIHTIYMVTILKKISSVTIHIARIRLRDENARLHLQFLLRFLVRFSSSDACEGVDKL
jgi:hypothetical protein